MSVFTGTGRLALLALRRDRVKLPVWILAITSLFAIAVPTLEEVYGTSEKAITEYAASMANNFLGRMFGGPMDGPYFGSIIMIEYFLFSAVLVIFMSTLAVVRHTRQNEETGRSELIGSGIVGRYASLTAALLVAVGANLLVGILVAVSLIAQGLPEQGSIAMAAGLAGVGVAFSGIAAVAAQVIGSARGANALIGAFIGLAVLVRGLGDSLGDVAPNGLAVQSTWLSWLSPIGWGQQMHPFSDPNWLPVGLFGSAFVALTGLAYTLASHRDHGTGLFAARRGRAKARKTLLSPLGLAWRLQRATIVGWGLGVILLGLVLGISAVEFGDFFEQNEQLKAVLAAMADGENFIDIYFRSMMLFMTFILAGYGLQSILRLRSEESSGHIEPVLSAAVGRYRWALSHIAVVTFGVVLLCAVAGFTTGLGYALVAENAWSDLGRITIAGLVQAPSILVLVGFAVLLFGTITRWSNAITWGAFTLCLLIAQFGTLLKLPDWLQKISPFYHTPDAPASSIDMVPLFIMLGVALVLTVTGLVAFRRRNLSMD